MTTSASAEQTAGEPASEPAGSPEPSGSGGSSRRNTAFVLGGLLVAFLLAGFLSGYASSSPDGLEKVAEEEGFAHTAKDHSFADWPVADYAVSGIDNERLAGGVAGIIGVCLVFLVGGAVALGLAWLRSRRRPVPAAG